MKKKVLAALIAVMSCAGAFSVPVNSFAASAEKTASEQTSEKGSELQAYADEISDLMLRSRIAGYAFVRDDKVVITYSAYEDKIKTYIDEKGYDKSIFVYEAGKNVAAEKESALKPVAEDINEYMRSNGISGFTYVQEVDGVEKIFISYDGFFEKIKAYVTGKGIDENIVVYQQSHDDVIVSAAVSGDINNDGTFNIADVVAFQKWPLGDKGQNIANWKAADLCADDRLDVFDLTLMKRALIKEVNKVTTTETSPVVFEMTPSKTGVDEFLANNPTIKSTYTDDELFNITPQEITEMYGFKIFKYSQNCETYLEYQGEVHHLGTGWGGPGTVSFAIADLNGDKHYELYFTYSWGSGLNHAVIDCFDTSSSVKFEGFDQYWSDDVVLAVENGKLGVYKAKYTSSGFVSIKAVPTEKLGEITADNETNKVVFVPLNSSDTDLDKSAIAGKIFAYEKEGAGGYCTLSFNENGRFLYYPGKLSSYMSGGDWKIDGDTVSLIGMVDKTIYLKITDDTLVYIAEGSDEFPYMDIKDGEKFGIYRPEISSDKFQLNSRYSEYGLGNPKVELDLIASELPEFCYVEDVRLYDEDDNFIGMMSPAMDADIWSYLVDCNVTEECSKTYYTLTKIRCGAKTYLDDVRSEITVNFKVAPAP
ncbi:MAG TPA: dockerin type I repeat-containing protein [Ruminococcus flavefaciens]|nr:dockerin type I repeat-containing protein [Ruminococcus flavefaciens]